MFTIHPSRRLLQVFSEKPYQGAGPTQASLIFVGLDANYAATIDADPMFPQLLEYHADGPGFWRTHGVHHPFLLPGYRGAGRKYHKNFSQTGFSGTHADSISFVELLAVPTVGRSTITKTDLDPKYLSHLRKLLFGGRPKKVFVSPGVVRLMNQSGAFPELVNLSLTAGKGLPIYYQSGTTTVYKHLHFSVYGKFERRRLAEAEEIRLAGLQA